MGFSWIEFGRLVFHWDWKSQLFGTWPECDSGVIDLIGMWPVAMATIARAVGFTATYSASM
jgi:hypothetical protein